MPNILNLKFKGNKSFIAFSNLNDTEALTRTWKVCSKVASYLEQGQRLENLSWRLWHLQNLMVDTDNAKSKREFRKLSKCMGDKLDKEKGRSIEELEAPDFKYKASADIIRQRAVEKERSREASHNARPGTIDRMQFTFSVDGLVSSPAVSSSSLSSTTSNTSSVSSSPPVTKKPDHKQVSAEYRDGIHRRVRGPKPLSRSTKHSDSRMSPADADIADDEAELQYMDAIHRKKKRDVHDDDCDPNAVVAATADSVHFPSYFPNGFDASVLMYGTETLPFCGINYGEGVVGQCGSAGVEAFSVMRPTIELPFEDLLLNAGEAMDTESSAASSSSISDSTDFLLSGTHEDDTHVSLNATATIANPDANNSAAAVAAAADIANAATPRPSHDLHDSSSSSSSSESDDEHDITLRNDRIGNDPKHSKGNINHNSINNQGGDNNNGGDLMSTSTLRNASPNQTAIATSHTKSKSVGSVGGPSSGLRGSTRASASGRPALTVRTQPLTSSARTSGPGATATNVNPAVLRSGGSNTSGNNTSSSGTSTGAAGLASTVNANNSAPGGVKAECSNCGATHTPLWRRGLNDELNCNACGLYCKLHKRPRPKSMRNTHGEGRTQAAPRPETVDVMAQCYNCHTTATPLWRKDDEGKTVCNACGLYYKLHGSARPISMKSDVIRKRSRHDARRSGQVPEESLAASPGASGRASSIEPSPILAPDSTTQMSYDYSSESEYRTPQSELSGALGQETNQSHFSSSNAFSNFFGPNLFPGPYHPDFMLQHQQSLYGGGSILNDALPFASPVDSPPETEIFAMSPRLTKRRRMSTESASEPPSSAVSSFSSFDGYSSSAAASSSTSLSQRSSMEFSYNGGNSANGGSGGVGSYQQHQHQQQQQQQQQKQQHQQQKQPYGAIRRSGNTFWHPPMALPPGSPPLFHPPMLLSEDYLHPPMLPQEEESLFSTYLHPPMVLQEDRTSPAPAAGSSASGGAGTGNGVNGNGASGVGSGASSGAVSDGAVAAAAGVVSGAGQIQPMLYPNDPIYGPTLWTH